MMAHLNPGVDTWLWVVVMAALVTTAVAEKTLIPPIPASQEDSPLAHLWRHALDNQEVPSEECMCTVSTPETFVAPDDVINWVPQDSPHPLYVPEYADLLREILLDYMVVVKVQPGDPRMSEPNGLKVNNLNGKTLTFTRDASGIKINGVSVIKFDTNLDGTVSYILAESLFGHRERVQHVWEEYIETVPLYDPFGRPL